MVTDSVAQVVHKNATGSQEKVGVRSCLFFDLPSRDESFNEKNEPWRRQTIKNCATEAPEGDSWQTTTALCNAGRSTR